MRLRICRLRTVTEDAIAGRQLLQVGVALKTSSRISLSCLLASPVQDPRIHQMMHAVRDLTGIDIAQYHLSGMQNSPSWQDGRVPYRLFQVTRIKRSLRENRGMIAPREWTRPHFAPQATTMWEAACIRTEGYCTVAPISMFSAYTLSHGYETIELTVRTRCTSTGCSNVTIIKLRSHDHHSLTGYGEYPRVK